MLKSARILVLLGALLCAACVTTPVADEETRGRYERQMLEMAAGPIAVVADSCVVRDEVGEDFVLMESARLQGRTAAERIKDRLRQRGLFVARALSPYVCGSVDQQDLKDLSVRDNSGGDTAQMSLPVVQDQAALADPALAQAYRDLIQQAAATRFPAFVSEGQPEPAVLALPVESRELLRRELQADWVWVAVVNSADVSAGKSIGVGLLTGLLTMGVTGGAAIAVTTLADGNSQQASLIDLKSGNVIWKKKVSVQRGAPAMQNMNWAQDLLSPFLVVGAQPLDASLVYQAQPAQVLHAYTAPTAPTVPTASAAAPAPAPAPAAVAVLSASAASTQVESGRFIPDVAVPVLSRPVYGATVVGLAPAGAALSIKGITYNASGEWRYVTGAGLSGWVPSESKN